MLNQELAEASWQRVIGQRQRAEREVDLYSKKRTIGGENRLARELNQYKDTLLFELLQNADDAPIERGTNSVVIELVGNKLAFAHQGALITEEDFYGLVLQDISSVAKRINRNKSGYKGIGFKSVFIYGHDVLVRSGQALRFKMSKQLSERELVPWRQMPYWVKQQELHEWNAGFSPAVVNAKVAFIVQIKSLEKRVDVIRMVDQLMQCPERVYFMRSIRSMKVVVDGIERHVTTNIEGERIKVCHDDSTLVCRLYEYSHLAVPQAISAELRNGANLEGMPDRMREIESTSVQVVLHPIDKSPAHNLSATLPMVSTAYGLPYVVNAEFLPNTDRSDVDHSLRYNLWLLHQCGRCAADVLPNLWEKGTENDYALAAELIQATLQGADVPSAMVTGFRERFLELELPDTNSEVWPCGDSIADPLGLLALFPQAALAPSLDFAGKHILYNTLSRLRLDAVATYDFDAFSRTLASPEASEHFSNNVEAFVRFAVALATRRPQLLEADAERMSELLCEQLQLRTQQGEFAPFGKTRFGVPAEFRAVFLEVCQTPWSFPAKALEDRYAEHDAFRRALGNLGSVPYNEARLAAACVSQARQLRERAATDGEFAVALWRTLFALRDVRRPNGGDRYISASSFGELVVPVRVIPGQPKRYLSLSQARLDGIANRPQVYALLFRLANKQPGTNRIDLARLSGGVNGVAWRSFFTRLSPTVQGDANDEAYELLKDHKQLGEDKSVGEYAWIMQAAIHYLQSPNQSTKPLPDASGLRIPAADGQTLVPVKRVEAFEHNGQVYARHPEYPVLCKATSPAEVAAEKWLGLLGITVDDILGLLGVPRITSTDLLRRVTTLQDDAVLAKLSRQDDVQLTHELFKLHCAFPNLQRQIPYGKLRFRSTTGEVHPGYYFVPHGELPADATAWMRCKYEYALRLGQEYDAYATGSAATAWAKFIARCNVQFAITKVPLQTLRIHRTSHDCLDLPHQELSYRSTSKGRVYAVLKSKDVLPDIALALGNSEAIHEIWKKVLDSKDPVSLIRNSFLSRHSNFKLIPSHNGISYASALYPSHLKIFSEEVKAKQCGVKWPSEDSVSTRVHFIKALSHLDLLIELEHSVTHSATQGVKQFFTTITQHLPATFTEELLRTLSEIQVPTLSGKFRLAKDLVLIDRGEQHRMRAYALADEALGSKLADTLSLSEASVSKYVQLLKALGTHAVQQGDWKAKHSAYALDHATSKRVQSAKQLCVEQLRGVDIEGADDLASKLAATNVVACTRLELALDQPVALSTTVQAHYAEAEGTLYVVDEVALLDAVFDKGFSGYKGDSLAAPIRQRLNPQAVVEQVSDPTPAKTAPSTISNVVREPAPRGAVDQLPSTPLVDTPTTSGQSKPADRPYNDTLTAEEEIQLKRGLEQLGLEMPEDKVHQQHIVALGLAADYLLLRGGSVRPVKSGQNGDQIHELVHTLHGIDISYIVSGARYGLLRISSNYWDQINTSKFRYLVVVKGGVDEFVDGQAVLDKYGRENGIILQSKQMGLANELTSALRVLDDHKSHALFLVPDLTAEKQLASVFRERKAMASPGQSEPQI